MEAQSQKVTPKPGDEPAADDLHFVPRFGAADIGVLHLALHVQFARCARAITFGIISLKYSSLAEEFS